MACGCPSEQCFCFLVGDALTGGSGTFASPWTVENTPFAASSPLNSIQITPAGVKGHSPGLDVRLSADPNNAAEYAVDGILVDRCGIVTGALVATGQILTAGAGCTASQLNPPTAANQVIAASGGSWGQRPLVSADALNSSSIGTDGGVFTTPASATSLFATGMMIDFAGDSTQVPASWLLCDGSAVTVGSGNIALRNLLIAAGNPYGVSGADPLLPDLRGRASYGVGTHADVNQLGVDNDGLAVAARTPRHTHTVPSLAIPVLGVAALSIPPLSVPALSIPGLTLTGASNSNVVPTANTADGSTVLRYRADGPGSVTLNQTSAVLPAAPALPVGNNSATIAAGFPSNSHFHNIAAGAILVSGSTVASNTGGGVTGGGVTGAGSTAAGVTGTGVTGQGFPPYLVVNKIIKT